MFRKGLLLLALLILSLSSFAGTDSSSHLRISLLTCGPGDEEVWEVFGHTAVRVVDSAEHLDLVYNYGTFEFGPNFELQFMRGKLLYCLSVDEFSSFMPEYVMARRSVQEQVLTLTDLQKSQVYAFLNRNAEPANKYYKYDFFFDNCATRIRDVFPRVFGSDFRFGNVLPVKRITFRNIMNQYFYKDHWTRMGVNILLGSKIDRPMSNADIMFLPDYLRDGVGGATVNGRPIASPSRYLLPGGGQPGAEANWPLMVGILIALLTIAGLSVPSLRVLGRIMSTLLLLVTGLLGCLILIMWFGTDHQGCSDNYNLLWCLPTNLIALIPRAKGRSRYGIIGIVAIIASVLLHILKIQGLTIVELAPLLLSLLCVFGAMYRNSPKTK
jgi:Domain of unknown function (DUF4105)